MKKIKFIVSFVLIISLLGISTKVEAEPLSFNPVNLTAEEQVSYFANVYNTDANLINNVIKCESGWEHNVYGDNGRSYGIFQFQKSSFDRIAKAFGEELDYKSKYDQIKLGVWAISNGYGNEWTAFRAIKNGGRYSFYSKQLNKHFTVYCK